jgi:hypothetical protein
MLDLQWELLALQAPSGQACSGAALHRKPNEKDAQRHARITRETGLNATTSFNDYVSSSRRRQGSRITRANWIPAFAGMTKLLA